MPPLGAVVPEFPESPATFPETPVPPAPPTAPQADVPPSPPFRPTPVPPVPPPGPCVPSTPFAPGAPSPAVTVQPRIVTPPFELRTLTPTLLLPSPAIDVPVALWATTLTSCSSVGLLKFAASTPSAFGLCTNVTFVDARDHFADAS